MDERKRCFLIPPDQQRCVWMDAGVLPYQLCTRPEGGCGSCTIDAALRWHAFSPWSNGVELRTSNACDASPALLEGVRYSRNHFWVRRMSPVLVRIGLEPGLVEALVNIKGIVFPSLNISLGKNQACAWAVMDAGTLPLEAPVAGVLAAVNRELIAQPHLLALRPFHDGWICELSVANADAEIGSLMAIGDALSRFAADQQRFAGSLGEATRSKRVAAGPGLAEEAISLRSFVDKVGPGRYLGMVRQCFGWTGYYSR